MPALFIQLGDRRGGQIEIVADEDIVLLRRRVIIFYPAHLRRILRRPLMVPFDHDLVAANAGSHVNGVGIQTAERPIAFGARDKVRASFIDREETTEIIIAAVKDIVGSGFKDDPIQESHIGPFSSGKVEKSTFFHVFSSDFCMSARKAHQKASKTVKNTSTRHQMMSLAHISPGLRCENRMRVQNHLHSRFPMSKKPQKVKKSLFLDPVNAAEVKWAEI